MVINYTRCMRSQPRKNNTPAQHPPIHSPGQNVLLIMTTMIDGVFGPLTYEYICFGHLPNLWESMNIEVVWFFLLLFDVLILSSSPRQSSRLSVCGGYLYLFQQSCFSLFSCSPRPLAAWCMFGFTSLAGAWVRADPSPCGRLQMMLATAEHITA